MGEKYMDGLQKINKGLLTAKVEEKLLDFILREPIEVGEKIPNEFTLAEMFGVGRGTVREAVKSLASKGVLEVRRGLGTFVISTSTLEQDPLGLANVLDDQYELALQLFEVRLMFEPEIAALASVYILQYGYEIRCPASDDLSLSGTLLQQHHTAEPALLFLLSQKVSHHHICT